MLSPTGQLREGNAIINVGFTAAGAAGPAIAGVVVAALGVQTALLIDAASFVAVAAVLAAASRCRGQGRAGAVDGAAASGARLRAAQRRAERLLVVQAAAFVFFTLVLPIEIVYAKETLDAGDSGYGALLSAWGIGMVIGSLVFVAPSRRAPLRCQLFCQHGSDRLRLPRHGGGRELGRSPARPPASAGSATGCSGSRS